MNQSSAMTPVPVRHAAWCICIGFAMVTLALTGIVPVHAQDDGNLLQTLRRERDALHKQVQDQRRDMGVLEQTNAELRARIDEIAGGLNDERRTVTELRQQLAAAEQREQHLLDLVDKERERARRLADVIRELRNLVATQAGAVDVQAAQIRSLKGETGELESRLAQAREQAGVVERRIEQVQEAARQETDKARQQRADMHYNLGVIYGNRRMYELAEREFLRSLEHDPDGADAHYNLGVIYDEAFRDRDKAAIHFQRYLELNPTGADAQRVQQWIAALESDRR